MSYSVSRATLRRSALLSAPLALSLALATLLVPAQASRADDTTTTAPAAPAGQAPAGQLPDAGASKPIDPKTVVARVNGKNITRQDLIDMAASLNLPPQMMQNLDAIMPKLTERAVGMTLLSQEGLSQKLQDDPEVKAKLDRIQDEIVGQIFLSRVVKAKLTDDMVKAKYDQDLKDHPPQDEVKVAHILVKTEKEANDILAELKKGGDFAKLAKDKSIDKGSAVNGGDLGMYFTQNGGEVVQPFADAAFTLAKTGDVTNKAVQTQFGWHLIKLEDRRKQTPPSFEEERDQLKQQMANDIIQQEIKDLTAKAKIETFNPDGTPVKQ